MLVYPITETILVQSVKRSSDELTVLTFLKVSCSQKKTCLTGEKLLQVKFWHCIHTVVYTLLGVMSLQRHPSLFFQKLLFFFVLFFFIDLIPYSWLLGDLQDWYYKRQPLGWLWRAEIGNGALHTFTEHFSTRFYTSYGFFFLNKTEIVIFFRWE